MLSLKEKVDPKHAAVIIVDVQNDFCHSEGGFGKRKRDLTMIQESVKTLADLVTEARNHDVPVVFVRTIHGPWTNSDTWIERFKDVSIEEVPMCVGDSWGADFYVVQPQPGDPVVVKHRYSGFYCTDLDVILRARGIKTLIMAGVATNVCVETTARDGYMRDYHIVFVDDCCGTVSKEDHEATLRNIRNHFGIVVKAAEVKAAWA